MDLPQSTINHLAAESEGVPVLMASYHVVVLPVYREVNGEKTAFADPITMEAACALIRERRKPEKMPANNDADFIYKFGSVYRGS